MNKIIIVDDHSLFREGIKLLIENENLGEVIGEAENGQDFLNLLKTLSPDLVIMDVEMPVMGGLEAIRKGLKINHNLKILILSMQSEKSIYLELIRAGAMGIILKTSGKNEFEKAIKAIANDDNYFSKELIPLLVANSKGPSLQTRVDIQPETEKLTDRENEILQYLCEGLTVTEIAAQLFLSVKTVEAHRATLLRKTNSRDTLNLVLYGVKNKVVL